MVQNNNIHVLSCSMSWEPQIIWSSFMVHMCKMISPALFFSFLQNFNILGFQGGKRAKIDLKNTIFGPSRSISQELCIISSRFSVHRCKIMISPGIFLIFWKKCNIVNIKILLFFIDPLQQFFSNKQLFFKFISKCQKEILSCSTLFTCV